MNNEQTDGSECESTPSTSKKEESSVLQIVAMLVISACTTFIAGHGCASRDENAKETKQLCDVLVASVAHPEREFRVYHVLTSDGFIGVMYRAVGSGETFMCDIAEGVPSINELSFAGTVDKEATP